MDPLRLRSQGFRVAWRIVERCASARPCGFGYGHDGQTCLMFVHSQQARKLSLLENQPFGEAPRAAAPLVLEVDPRRPGTRMPKSLPEHRKIIAIRAKANDVLDTDSLGIAALKPVCNAQRAALALAAAAQKALIPAAGRQLIPDEGGYAA